MAADLPACPPSEPPPVAPAVGPAIAAIANAEITEPPEARAAREQEPTSPIRPTAPAVGDLQMYLFETAPVMLIAPASAAPAAPATTSIRAAWQSFIDPAPPRKRHCDRAAIPPSAIGDRSVKTLFRHPPDAVPPPRLPAFALPSNVRPDAFDRPADVCFCLTLANGHRVHGAALQLVEQIDGDGAADDSGPPQGRVVLRALVLLSKWPVHELWRTMLHTIYSRGETIGPTGALCAPPPEAAPASEAALSEAPAAAPSASPPSAAAPAGTPAAISALASAPAEALNELLLHTCSVLSESHQEIQWLTTHPLYLPTPLAPLFKALGWRAGEAAYLLAAVLTDQKVLLHSDEPHRLYCATNALRALITPLAYSGVFIPLLPTHLMSLDEAYTLLHDCGTPYLIGCESALLRSFGVDDPLPRDAVVVDLDQGIVRRAPVIDAEWYSAVAPPYAVLTSELQRCMGAGSAFKALRAQAACLRFVVDALNVQCGFLARSRAPADADALERFQLLEAFATEATARCQQQAKPGTPVGVEAVDVMRAALHASVGGMLAGVCTEAHLRHGGAAVTAARSSTSGAPVGVGGGGGSGGSGMRARSASSVASLGSLGGSGLGGGSALGEWTGLIGDPVAGESSNAGGVGGAGGGSCCGALSHIYASQPFREWWGEPGRTRTGAERLQWLDYRAKGVDLIEYLRENHRSMKVLERSLEQRLHAIWAAEPALSPTAATADADAHAPAAELAGRTGGHRRSVSEPPIVSPRSSVTSTRGEGAALALASLPSSPRIPAQAQPGA